MAESLNQQLADAMTRRQIQVAREERRERAAVLALLLALERDILAAIRAADPTEAARLLQRLGAVEVLMDETLEPLIALVYTRIARETTEALIALAEEEAALTMDIVNQATGEETMAVLPTPRQLRRVVTETLIPSVSSPTEFSTTGEDWWTRLAAALTLRLGDQLRVSVSLEEALPQMVERVRGTQAQGFQDGLMARARTDAGRLLRTEMSNALSEARVATAMVNPGQGLVLEHVSILDSRTSMICLSRDGLRYTLQEHEPIGHSMPYLNGVPYHPNCRSSIIPVLATGGTRPRETADRWLGRQTTAFQDEVLGPTRARMFRAGQLGVRDLINSLGQPQTLADLTA